jgi:hypothetical protein
VQRPSGQWTARCSQPDGGVVHDYNLYVQVLIIPRFGVGTNNLCLRDELLHRTRRIFAARRTSRATH